MNNEITLDSGAEDPMIQNIQDHPARVILVTSGKKREDGQNGRRLDIEDRYPTITFIATEMTEALADEKSGVIKGDKGKPTRRVFVLTNYFGGRTYKFRKGENLEGLQIENNSKTSFARHLVILTQERKWFGRFGWKTISGEKIEFGSIGVRPIIQCSS